MPTQKEKNIALYEREYETFEDQLRNWYRTRQASTMQKLLAGNHAGTDVINRIMSEMSAEEIQALLQQKANLEQLRVLETEKEEAGKTAGREQEEAFWTNLVAKLGEVVASTIVTAVGAPWAIPIVTGVGEASKTGVSSLFGLGTGYGEAITTQQTKQAEIESRIQSMQNYLDQLKMSPEFELPEEYNLSLFEGRGKSEPWWTYWQG